MRILRNIKIKYKISILPVIAFASFILILLVNHFFSKSNKKLITAIEVNYVSALELSRDLEKTFTLIQYALQNAVAAADIDELSSADSLSTFFVNQLQSSRDNPNTDSKTLDELYNKFLEYYPLAIQTSKKMIGNELDEQTIKDLEKMRNEYNLIMEKLQHNISRDKRKMRDILASAKNNYQISTYYISGIIVIIIIVFSYLSFYIVKSIILPLREVVNSANELALGNLDVTLNFESNDEIGELAYTFSSLIASTHHLTKTANSIGAGEYDVPIKLRSEKDVLGKALLSMKKNLIEISEENKTQNWLKTGQTELADSIQAVQEISVLSQKIITFLANYLKAQVGALYILDDDNILKLYGTYAYTRRKNLSNEYKMGEGIIGQAALEGKNIVLTNVPKDYISINSGLGETAPRNILVVPFLYEMNIKGVIELGSLEEFTELKIEFINQSVEKIAIAVHAAQSQYQMKKLLGKTQEQARKLENQQEAMQQINDELEEQTKYLKESEARLQVQQQELQQTNEELEEKTQELEKQKGDVQKKNQQLEETRRLLESKARDLELTSKYKSEFLANMSHELRTPLNSLLILSKILVDNKDGNLTKKQIEFASTINMAGNDLLKLINDILDLSKVESGKMDIYIEKVILNDFLIEIERKFKAIADEKSLSFKVIKDDDVPNCIYTDNLRLEQIIKNFLSNAFKFTEKGDVTCRILKPQYIDNLKNDKLHSTDIVAFAVSDTGKGIAPEKQKLVFEAFQQEDGTTSRKYGGTGLGLSISKELAKILNGEITLTSEEGKGSTFTLYLPLKLKDNTPEHAGDAMTSRSVSQKRSDNKIVIGNKRKSADISKEQQVQIMPDDKSILIIDDDDKFIEILVDCATKKGFKCITANDGVTAIELAQKYVPSAIILDIGLPGKDGLTVMSILKENPKTRHIPVHFISASDKSNVTKKMGALGFLLKPISLDELNRALNKVEKFISRSIKKLLVVEDDNVQSKSIEKIIGNGDVQTITVQKGMDAFSLLKSEKFDCMVLDLVLEDISGFQLIEMIKTDKSINEIPIIIYTSKELTPKEQLLLEEHTESIIFKGKQSLELLLDETTLFLHRVEAHLPEDKQNIIRMFHDNETVFQNKKILIVDDDMRNVFALTNVLEQKGVKVLIGKNGREGLDVLDKNPDIDLILMDIMMPEMDGYEAIREIRKQSRYQKLSIIALTAKAMKGDRAVCINAGASDYIAKPVDDQKLLSLLRVWLYQI